MKMRASLWRRGVIIAVLCGITNLTLAGDGVVQGGPFQVDVTDVSNFGFQVYIVTSTGWRNPAYHWAHLNSTDSNYSAYVAAILMAEEDRRERHPLLNEGCQRVLPHRVSDVDVIRRGGTLRPWSAE